MASFNAEKFLPTDIHDGVQYQDGVDTFDAEAINKVIGGVLFAQDQSETANSNAEAAQENAQAAEESAKQSEYYAQAAEESANYAKETVNTFQPKYEILRKRIVNLEQGLDPDPNYEDETVAFVKSVPENALPYAQIGEVGGMTYKVKEPNPAVRFEFDCEEGEFGAYTGLTYDATTKTVTLDTSRIPEYEGNKTGVPSVYMFTQFFHGVGLELGKTYTIGYKTDNPSNYMYPNGTFVFTEDIANFPISFNAPEGGIATFTDIVLVEGTTADTEVDVLHDTKVTAIESVGKNLCDWMSLNGSGACGVTEKDETSITVRCTVSRTYISRNFLIPDWLEGKTITVTGNWTASGSNKGGIRVIWMKGAEAKIASNIFLQNSGESQTAVVPKKHPDADGLRICLYGNTSGQAQEGDTVTYTNVQVEIGDTVTPFAPYRAPITLPIPAEVQALDGYGAGLPDGTVNIYGARIPDGTHNGIEWDENGKAFYVQRVKSVVCDGTENWWASTASGHRYYTLLGQTGLSHGACMSDRYPHRAFSVGVPCIYTAVAEVLIFPGGRLGETSSTKDDWKEWLAEQYAAGTPLKIVYQLKEPIVTDISHLVSADNFIEVEGGGAIIMQNEKSYAAPSTIIYQLKHTEA